MKDCCVAAEHSVWKRTLPTPFCVLSCKTKKRKKEIQRSLDSIGSSSELEVWGLSCWDLVPAVRSPFPCVCPAVWPLLIQTDLVICVEHKVSKTEKNNSCCSLTHPTCSLSCTAELQQLSLCVQHSGAHANDAIPAKLQGSCSHFFLFHSTPPPAVMAGNT